MTMELHHVSIVVDDLDAATAFFAELGMEPEGRAPVSGPWVDRINGLDDVRVTIAMMRTPTGHGRLELTKFHSPAVIDPNRAMRWATPSACAASCSRSTTSTPHWPRWQPTGPS